MPDSVEMPAPLSTAVPLIEERALRLAGHVARNVTAHADACRVAPLPPVRELGSRPVHIGGLQGGSLLPWDLPSSSTRPYSDAPSDNVPEQGGRRYVTSLREDRRRVGRRRRARSSGRRGRGAGR